MEIADTLQGSLIEKIAGSPDELLSVDISGDGCTYVFTTTHLNISAVDAPEGAYKNTFSLTFDPEWMSIDYTEAVPPRPAKLRLEIETINDLQTFRIMAMPFFEKLNLLLRYFNVDSQVKIP